MMESIPNYSLLREAAYLVALAEFKNLRRAGDHLGVSAEAVREGVRALATHTHRTQLFFGQRSGDVEISTEGEQLLVLARRLVDQATAMSNDALLLRFSTFPRLVARAARAVDAFHGDRRNVGVRVSYQDITDGHRRDGGRTLVRRASRGELDLVVAAAGIADPRVEETAVYSWRLRAVLPRRRFSSPHPEPVTVPELDGLDIVCAPRGHVSRDLLQRAFDEAGRVLVPTMEIVDQNVARWVAHFSDRLVTILPSDAFEGTEGPEALGPPLVDREGGGYVQQYSAYRAAALDQSEEEPHQRRQAALRRLAQLVRNELARYHDDDSER